MKSILLLFAGLIFSAHIGYAQQDNAVRTIYIMRVKQFYGSGVKMDVRVNDESIHGLKSGSRLILKALNTDTVKIQIVYPPIKKYRSEPVIISPDDNEEIYIDAFYWGEGYNPLKHSGPILGPNGKPVEFNVGIERLEPDEGRMKFRNVELFKDNFDQIPTIFYRPE